MTGKEFLAALSLPYEPTENIFSVSPSVAASPASLADAMRRARKQSNQPEEIVFVFSADRYQEGKAIVERMMGPLTMDDIMKGGKP